MALVVEYHEELEVDLAPVDLLDLWRGRLSFRRLELLIRHLDPRTSELVRAVNPDLSEMAEWDATSYLIAHLIDTTAAAHFKNPKPFPRPAQRIEQRDRDEARRAKLVERFEAKRRGV